MTTIPEGFALVSVPLQHLALARTAFVTFGVANSASETNPADAAETIWTPWVENFASRIDSNVQMGPLHVALGTSGAPKRTKTSGRTTEPSSR